MMGYQPQVTLFRACKVCCNGPTSQTNAALGTSSRGALCPALCTHCIPSVLTMHAARVFLDGFPGNRSDGYTPTNTRFNMGSSKAKYAFHRSVGSSFLYSTLPLLSMAKDPSNSPQTSTVMCTLVLAGNVMTILTRTGQLPRTDCTLVNRLTGPHLLKKRRMGNTPNSH